AGRKNEVQRFTDIAVAENELEIAEFKMDRVESQLTHAELAQAEAFARSNEMGIRPADKDDKGNAIAYMQDDDDQRRKLLQSGASGGAAFVLVSSLIVLLDMRRRRLNDALDVSDRLQINVLGTVPLLRGRGRKRLQQSARLAEAVDGVAATLLCRTSGDDHRVVMISSAMAGEGKTTLAANLATSLASAGRRTLLVDFDLRRPMLHQVYQMPVGPGLGELLSSPDLSDYAEYLQETGTEGLWLIPAGAKRQRAIAELADARTGELFQAFKEHFEFIIVDGPPVLPVVDTRLVARHADGVVISLLRDVSELPKVRSACQLLQSYKVRILGGVVIGASGDVYYGEPPERVSSIA
ncbi:MAG: CpsD/CapB family tyrosine-protein kinase, partial [Planctomycetaceae bacterium]